MLPPPGAISLMTAVTRLVIASGARLGLNGYTLRVDTLRLNSVDQAAGIYTAATHPDAFMGSGSLVVGYAPTLTTVSTLAGGTEDTALTISYETLAAAANEADVDGSAPSFRVEAVSTGTLTKGGTAVTAGTTLLSSGESLEWTPAAHANGTLNAFTVKAWDGTLASASAVQVQVAVTAGS